MVHIDNKVIIKGSTLITVVIVVIMSIMRLTVANPAHPQEFILSVHYMYIFVNPRILSLILLGSHMDIGYVIKNFRLLGYLRGRGLFGLL